MTSDDLKQWRADMGWSQRAAAEHLGITPTTYQALERGIAFATRKPVLIDRRTELACQMLKILNA